MGGVIGHRHVLVLSAILALSVSSSAGAEPRGEPALGWGQGWETLVIHHWPDPVNAKNANFFLPNKDISYPAPGFPLEIERSYNSRSLNDGPFGFGWSFNYDIYVRIGQEGFPEVVDADGFVCKFLPQGGGEKSAMEAQINRFMAYKQSQDKAAGIQRDAAFYQKYRSRLLNDPKLFEQVKSEMPGYKPELEEGTYISTTRGVQQLEVRKEGYKRTFTNGVTHIFYRMDASGKGRLRQMIDPAGNSLAMRYERGGSGDLREVLHSRGAKLEFTIGKLGKITGARIVTPDGTIAPKTVEYRYGGASANDLIGYKDTNGQVTRYDYDEWHNMTKITFPNGDVIQNRYDVDKDWILAQKGPGEAITNYDYDSDPADESHYWTIVNESGRVTRFDYYDGQNRVVTTDPEGRRTDRIFSECCGKPLRVTEPDGRVVNYEYDKRGNATRIWDNKGRNIRYQYDPKWNKVVKVLTKDSRITYRYDNQGNLVLGKDEASGLVVRLQYSSDGRVRAVEDGRGRAFEFRYNTAGKPVQIGPRGGKGAVVIDYNPDGTVSAVKTTGQVDQRQVLGDLQKLIQVVEPAYKFEL